MKINHPLMHNNFLNSDMNAVRKLIRTKNLMLTQSKKVLEFEKKWSKWLGVKYSVFVNSGSSANFISMLILKSQSPKKKEIIVPATTVKLLAPIHANTASTRIIKGHGAFIRSFSSQTRKCSSNINQ